MANILAIVGRPNVGKSTLFNRLTKTRRAIVNDTAGTTRDRQYGKSEWCGKEFSVIDTGGWVVNSDDTFESEINRQVNLAIKEADVILLVVDVNSGVTQFDMEVAHLLRQAKKETVLAVNKVDQFDQQYGAPEFYKLGLGEPFILSAENGLGTGDLLDEICSRFKDTGAGDDFEDLPRFAIVGRPNAGKSSILNAFIGEERTIVTDIPGTTRDSIYTRYNKFGKDFYLVDTAGIPQTCPWRVPCAEMGTKEHLDSTWMSEACSESTKEGRLTLTLSATPAHILKNDWPIVGQRKCRVCLNDKSRLRLCGT